MSWKKEAKKGTKKDTKIMAHRKHTKIKSKRQRGLFGAELARRRAGKRPRMKGITVAELRSHLKESKGKKLRGSGTLYGMNVLKKVGAVSKT